MNVVPLRQPVPDEFLTREEVAQRYKVSLRTVDRWANREKNPMPSETWGLRVRRFRLAEIERWLRNEGKAA